MSLGIGIDIGRYRNINFISARNPVELKKRLRELSELKVEFDLISIVPNGSSWYAWINTKHDLDRILLKKE